MTRGVGVPRGRGTRNTRGVNTPPSHPTNTPTQDTPDTTPPTPTEVWLIAGTTISEPYPQHIEDRTIARDRWWFTNYYH